MATGAIAAAIAVFYLENLVLAEKLVSPAINNQPSAPLTVAAVFGMSFSAAALGWFSLAALERLTNHGRAIWTTIALLVLLISLAGPLTGTGITMANRLGLVLLHLTVAAILIPLLPDAQRRRSVARR